MVIWYEGESVAAVTGEGLFELQVLEISEAPRLRQDSIFRIAKFFK